MNADELRRLISQREGLRLDFKRELYDIHHAEPRVQKMQWGEFIKDILALANGNVGAGATPAYLVFGPEDHLRVDGTRVLHDIGDVRLTDQQILARVNTCCIPRVPDINCETVIVDGVRILVVCIPWTPYLHETTQDLTAKNGTRYTAHTAFIRVGEGIAVASAAERQAILADKQRSLNSGDDPATFSSPQFTVPFPRNPDFVGRDEDLSRLHAMMPPESESAGAFPVGLAGMGGIGKTQLAVEYAYRYRSEYEHGIFWIDASEPLATAFARVGAQLTFRASERTAEDEIRALGDYLSTRQKALIILDGLEDPLDLHRPVGAMLMLSNLPCRILFTSRRRETDRFQTMELTVLDEDPSLQLLLRHPGRHKVRAPEHPEHEDARAISRLLGGLPLALDIAAAHLGKRPKLPVAAYRTDLLTRGALEVLDDPRGGVRAEDLKTRHEAAITATLESQWDGLENEDARLLLRVAGQVGESGLIPTARLGLLANVSDQEDSFFGSPLTLAIEELAEAALVALNEDHIQLHPLVADFARTRAVPLEGPAFRRSCATNLAAALQEMRVLEDQVACRGVASVEGDLLTALEMMTSTGSEMMAQQREEDTAAQEYLYSLLRVLRREAHNLRGWDRTVHETYFVQQIYNRAATLGLNALRDRASERLSALGRPYLKRHWQAGRASRELVRTFGDSESLALGVEVLPDARRAISITGDGALKVWDLHTGALLRTLHEPGGLVRSVTALPDGQSVVWGSQDGTIRLWNIDMSGESTVIGTHDSSILAISVVQGGVQALTLSDDGTCKLWDLRNKQQLQVFSDDFDQVTSIAVTPDSRYWVSGCRNGTIKVRDLQMGTEIRRVQGHLDMVSAVVVTPDGRQVVSASADGTLKLWNLEISTLLCTLSGHRGPVYSVALLSDGGRILSASTDRTIRLWSLEDGAELRTLSGHTEMVVGVAATPDRHHALSVSASGTLMLWDLQAEEDLACASGHEEAVEVVVMTPDGQRLVSGGRDGTLRLWDVRSGLELKTLPIHGGHVRTLAVTPDGCRAVTGTEDGVLTLWDLAAGIELKTHQVHDTVTALAISADGGQVLTGSEDGFLRLWGIETGVELRSIEAHKTMVRTVAFARHGSHALSVSEHGTLKLWDLERCVPVREIPRHERTVRAVATTSDGARAFLASWDDRLMLWDLESGHLLRCWSDHAGTLQSAALTADGKRVFLAAGALRMWNLQTGEEAAMAGLEGELHCLAVGPDGDVVLAGDAAGNIFCMGVMESGVLSF